MKLALVLIATLMAALYSSGILAQQVGSSEPALIATTWQWVQFQSSDGSVIDVPNPEGYTVTLNSDSTVTVKSDCNSLQGSFTANDGAIDIEIPVSTRSACPPDSLEATFNQFLGDVAGYVVDGGILYLNLMLDAGNMVFVSAQPVELAGTTWQWIEFQSSDESVITVANPENYTVAFNSDGTVNIKSDCNSLQGSFTANEGTIGIELTVSTLAMCPPDSLDATFNQYLGDVAGYIVEDNVLYLNLKVDAGNMVFQPLEEFGLVGTTWQWLEFQGGDGSVITVANPQDYTITFNADGTVSVKSDCNMLQGNFVQGNGALDIALTVSTKALCPPDSLETTFSQDLGDVASYVIDGNMLYLNLMMDAGNIVLAAAAPELDETMWQWVEFRGGDGSTISIGEPAAYTLTLSKDGTATAKADCNLLRGLYTVSGGQLSIELGVSTLASCPPGSLYNEYQLYLGTVASYVIQDGTLYLNLMMDGGDLIFERSQ